jgi:hypothetical protein
METKRNQQETMNTSEKIINPKEQLLKLCQHFYNAQQPKYGSYELETKFGTKGIKGITKRDFDNVIKKLKSLNFTSTSESGNYTLKIQPEFIDPKTGRFRIGDVDKYRVEIYGINDIQDYCRNNTLPHSANIMKKFPVLIDNTDTIYRPADFNDFNFRVTLMTEETVNKKSKAGADLIENWNKNKKVFRLINRVSFEHPNYPVSIDLSIVRSSSKNERGFMIPTYNMDESGVLSNPEFYEIEIEVNHVQSKLLCKNPSELVETLQNINKIILCGLQRTNFPISYPQQKQVLKNYMKLLFDNEFKKRGEEYVPKDRIYPSDFIGPSSKALQIKNIGQINPDFNVPNITETNSFCVTEKADGERHLLFVDINGQIYLINTNMNVIFTGAKTVVNDCFNSLIDGELIIHDKTGKFINKFAAFDIYFINGNDVRSRPFVKIIDMDEKYFKDGTRLKLLKEFIKKLDPMNILQTLEKNNSGEPEKKSVRDLLAKISKTPSPIKIVSKNFYPNFDSYVVGEPSALTKYNIFEACNFILRKIQSGLFEYEVDGLIFTSTLFGVGGKNILESGPKRKITWDYSFKWKPTEVTETFKTSYLTIDFLVLTKKGADGNDIVTPVFENGVNAYDVTQFNQYKTLTLAVGFDQSKHGFVNPCQDLLEDNFPTNTDERKKRDYKPKQFYPTDPYDQYAGICNIMLKNDFNNKQKMFTEEDEIFEDQTIVEFRYEMSNEKLWKWIPMRVRHDKTADFKAGLDSFGNDYSTANDNWYSIHNPVTEKMIATGLDIPGIEISDSIYYNSVTDDKLTKSMRDFHNLYVKKKLITSVAKKSDILIDFGCGKAGDLPKWIAAELSFVFGIDNSKDNIENRLNGACTRYLNYKKDFKNMPYALFVNGNCSLNIRSGKNMFTDKANEITKSVFGIGGVNESLGPAVKRQYSRGINGFDISSCQFAMHYMFENKNTFYGFIRNIAECTKINGYFIATSYDGKTIFNMLKKYRQGESKDIYFESKKVWSVIKDYDALTFEDNDSSLGYKITVYQDTINQNIPEYLVNFDFFTNEMEKYGFTLVQRSEAKRMGLPEGSGMFSELYNMMRLEIDKDPSKEKNYKDAVFMEDYEKNISFLNRYFVYKKTSSRNAEKLTRAILEHLPEEIEYENRGTILAKEAVKEAEEQMKPKARRIRDKLVLQDATEALEEVKASKIRKTKKAPIQLDIQEDVVEVVEAPEEEMVIKPKRTTRKKKSIDS